MTYSVQHVRVTLECDACGRIEKRNFDSPSTADSEMIVGWGLVEVGTGTGTGQSFCCPECIEKLNAIVLARPRAEAKAKADLIANCQHPEFVQRGLLRQCSKCGTFPTREDPSHV